MQAWTKCSKHLLHTCVNTLTDGANCGGCNNLCGGGATCHEGTCTCTGDLTYCVDKCVNTQTDADNCGACLANCTGDQGCYLGGCATPYAESCDGKDNDFDGATDEDEDGHPLTRACDNLCGAGVETCNSGHYTGCTAPTPVTETCNGQDDDCDGLVDEGVMNTYYDDYDGDGYGDPDLAWSIQACSLPSGASESGGVYVDNSDDCNDLRGSVNPDEDEVCDGIYDENCNGVVDENCGCSPLGATRACGTDEGICVAGTQTCGNTDWSICAGEGYTPAEATETCNGLDDDCDGEIDEELADDPYEANDTCEAARVLPDVYDSIVALPVEGLNLYHGAASDTADHDWFKVNMAESDHLVECSLAGWPPMQNQCGFVATVGMTVPADEVHGDYELCVYTGACGSFDNTFCTNSMDYDAATHRYSMSFIWNGTCGIDDSWNLFVEVKNADQMVQSCETYGLDFDLSWGGDVQEDSCGG